MKKTVFLLIMIFAFLITACDIPHTDPTATPTEEPTPTETPVPLPTPTMPPAAARVNGLIVAIEDVDIKKAQLREAYEQLGEPVPDDDSLYKEALNSIIDETLFLSAAQLHGIAPDATDVETKIQALCISLGSCDSLRDWQKQNHYSEDSFRRALERESASANMREIIFAQLKEAEQLHVFRIWSDRRSDLDEVMNRLNMGISFLELAKNYDAVTNGDMSWFPRGVLSSQELEDKIFALDTGEHTEILEIDDTYNIFYVAEKQTGRQMDTQVQQLAERKALSDWLEEQRHQADIEVF